ncbi:hypothetical protein CERSUDRAFT_56828, partial [Gelatoporia subvermispora B]
PQCPESLMDVLPLSMTDILMPICVVFVDSVMPLYKWVLLMAKPLAVRHKKV